MIKIYNDCSKDNKFNCIKVSGFTSDIYKEITGIIGALAQLVKDLNEFDKRGKYEKRKNF